MNDKLTALSEIIAQANDKFSDRNRSIDTLMGIMDKSLRQQGMPADAITIDCPAQNKKIVLLLHDDKPDSVNVTLGDKSGVIHASKQVLLTELTVKHMLSILEDNLLIN